ncbi:MAG: flagellar hook-length control protein FliK [Acetatifactor sp.]
MWITDLLQAGKQTGNTRNTQDAQGAQSAGREPSAAALRNEIRALTPGQVISGQVLDKAGEELKLLVNFRGSEFELQARLEQNMALSMGRNILFQVKNNGSNLSLSPLFENMGMEANAQKAVEMASLPVNDTTMQLVGQLMKEGMPIDREALLNFYHEATTFADAEILDIIDLHKLGLAVNAENLEQISSYKNMTHRLMGGINDLSGQLPQLLQEMADQGMGREIGKIFEALLLGENGQPLAGLEESREPAAEGGAQPSASQTGETAAGPESGKIVIVEERGEFPQLSESGKAQQGQETVRVLEGNVPETLREQSDNAGQGSSVQEQAQKASQPQSPAQGPAFDLLRQAARILSGESPSPARERQILELAKSPEFQRQLRAYVKQELSLRPEDTDREKLDQVYGRLSRQLGALSEALGSAGQESSALGRTVQNLNQNLNFMNQLNDQYAYVQLPLKMSDRDAHGELYVYANKSKKTVREGEVSALLHLDMENLGPMDIYVQLQDNHVGTRFYLPDEAMLDFIAEHIDLLNSRLEKRGYQLNCAFQTRELGTENTVMQELIEENSNRPMSADYSFDAFA